MGRHTRRGYAIDDQEVEVGVRCIRGKVSPRGTSFGTPEFPSISRLFSCSDLPS